MADLFSSEQRSQIMRSVKGSRNKSTEEVLVSFFKRNKIKGWRRHYRLFGSPDFTFPLTRIVVFTDGCFWHGHNCRNTKPKNNASYWENKVEKNRSRDALVSKILCEKGWEVIRIWECSIKDKTLLDQLVKKVQKQRQSGSCITII